MRFVSDGLGRRAARLGAVVVIFAAAQLPSAGSAQTPDDNTSNFTEVPPVAAFTGSAVATGVRLTGTVPGAPVTDTPVDGGGPTAEATLDSIGAGTGYAAFPDPGGLVIAGPGLVAGVLSGGAGGLPPINLPVPPPNYPLYVSSDANSPEQSVGEGAYRLEAVTNSHSSTASATVGFQPDVVGNVALSTATASVEVSDVNDVVSEATSDLQTLTVGPLVIGEIKSKATMKLDPYGTVIPSTSLEIVGMRVGNLPVSLTPEGLVVAGSTRPVPVNDSLAKLLSPSKMSVEVLAGETFPDRVVAPALRINLPFNTSASGGAMTLTVGGAVAILRGASSHDNVANEELFPGAGPTEAPGEASGAAEGGAVSDGGSAHPLGKGGGADFTTSDVLESAVSPWGATVAEPAPLGSLPAIRVAPSASSALSAAEAEAGGIERFDIGGAYLGVVASGLFAVMVGFVTRFLGVRRKWAFLAG